MAIHAEDLRRFLAESVGRPVTVKLNSNTHSLISVRPDGPGGGLRVSLHRMFLEADGKVLSALARFLTGPTPAARRTIRAFINENDVLVDEARSVTSASRISGSGRGRTFHLEPRANMLNQRHFEGRLRFRIIWGKGVRNGRRQYHVTLGTWNDRQRVIRIHPMLDQPAVPEYFLDYIIYHEMVHIAVPARMDNGRRLLHTREFYDLERAYPYYGLAAAWEKKWLPKLIAAWSAGKALDTRADDFFPVG